MGTIHNMSERSEDEDVVVLRPAPAEPVDPARMVGLGGVEVRLGVRSPDYGTGTVVSFSANGGFVYWDKPLAGTSTHLLEHDLSYLERLERLP